VHHLAANDWFESLEAGSHFCFCRFTQLGLLRLLTAEAVMGDDVLQQPQAWPVYDQWLRDERVSFVAEPQGLEQTFRALTRQRQASPKVWADTYLAAFAEAAPITLVTFDRAFRGKVKPLVVLDAD
jgi:toxin-antitoxin system PIN domain toxin